MINRQDIESEIQDRVTNKEMPFVVDSIQRLIISQTWLVMEKVLLHRELPDDQLRKLVMEELKMIL